VEHLVGGHEIGGLPDDRETDVAHLRDQLVGCQLDAEPGDRLELVERPAGMTEPRPLILPNGTPHAATMGPTASVVLSPTPPVECLSTTLRPSAAPSSIVSPLRIIASVSANVSSPFRPRKYTAMQNAAIW